jgi:hypothetical protein
MDRAGKIPGGLISEVMNVHSRKLYMVSTAPELGQDYWTTAALPVVHRKALFGLLKSNVPDFYHQIIAIIRNSMEEAQQVHVQVRHVVTSVAEGEWSKSFPPPTPPYGYSAGARRKLKDTLGYDPL